MMGKYWCSRMALYQGLYQRRYGKCYGPIFRMHYFTQKHVNQKLERVSTVLLLLLLLLCLSRSEYPPGFRNKVDWRALVKLCSPNISKLFVVFESFDGHLHVPIRTKVEQSPTCVLSNLNLHYTFLIRYSIWKRKASQSKWGSLDRLNV